MQHVTLKDYQKETHLQVNRMIIALVVVLLLSILLLVRLLYLQLYHHDLYTTLSHQNHVDVLPIAPARGFIYDRNGVILAENRPVYSLNIFPERVSKLSDTVKQLRAVLTIPEQDVQSFKKRLQQKRRFEGAILRDELTEEEVALFSVNRHRFAGVEIETRLVRHYPKGDIFAHVLGYVGRINEEELEIIDTANYSATQDIGKIGLEKFYENELHGKVGHQQVEIDVRGRIVRTLYRTDPIPGKHLRLHLDASLQEAAQNVLQGRRAALVAIEPGTGAVLAMVSSPSFDPNLFVHGINSTLYKGLKNSRDKPLLNRALRGQYPPGSTIKPFYGLMGLTLGAITPEKSIYDPGYFRLPQQERPFRDWKKGGHGTVNLEKAIVESCDVYFYTLAQNVGITRMHDFMVHFGFGERTRIDSLEELKGLMPSQEWKKATYQQPWYLGETISIGIGQGYMLSTPLQLANATATMAARGERFQPRLAAKIEDASGKAQVLPPTHLNTVPIAHSGDWDLILDAMKNVVHAPNGTARRIGADAKYTIGGKTGTAQVYTMKQNEKYSAAKLDPELRDHALFIGFAPTENPKIAVAVVVENGGSGSGTAAPIVRTVLDHYLLPSISISQEKPHES